MRVHPRQELQQDEIKAAKSPQASAARAIMAALPVMAIAMITALTAAAMMQ